MIDGAWLVMSQGPQPGQTFMLDRDWLTIGRDPSNDIVISDPQVSRQHARITRQGKMMVIEDVGSTNGTFANGVRLTGPHVLSNGDVIGLGDGVTLTYYEVGIAADVAETVVGKPGSAIPASYAAPPQAPQPVRQAPAAPQVSPTAVSGMPVSPAPAMPPPSALPQVPPAYTISPPPPPQAGPPAVGVGAGAEPKSRKWLWIGCGALVLVVACVGVALALAFAPEAFWLQLRAMGIPIPNKPAWIP